MKNKIEKNINMLVFPRSNFGERDIKIFKEIGYNVSTCYVPGLYGFLLKAVRSLLRPTQWFKSYKKLKGIDVFFSWWAVSFDVVLLSKIFRKSCIIVAGGGEIETSKDIPKEYPAYVNSSIFRKWMIKLTLKFADKIISVSNYAKENADKIAKNPTNEVVYNTIDTKIFRPVTTEKKPYILTVAFLSKYRFKTKGILPLLEAFNKIVKKHPEYKLVYLGDDIETPNGRNIIKKRAKELKILDRVIFMDFFKTTEEYVHFLNQCKIYVQYSWNESFGVAMCEAMACGVPVIASNRTALPEVVGNAGLIADRENTDDLVEKIEMLINDENLYNELSKRGIERVRNNFSKEIKKQKLKRIVEEMISKHRKK